MNADSHGRGQKNSNPRCSTKIHRGSYLNYHDAFVLRVAQRRFAFALNINCSRQRLFGQSHNFFVSSTVCGDAEPCVLQVSVIGRRAHLR